MKQRQQNLAVSKRKVPGKTASKPLSLRNGTEVDAEQTFLPLLLMLGGLWGAKRFSSGRNKYGGQLPSGGFPWFGGQNGRFNLPNSFNFPQSGTGGWFPGSPGGKSGNSSGYGGFPGFGPFGNTFGAGGANQNAPSENGGFMRNGSWPFFF